MLAIGGGDGTVSCAAVVAVEQGVPLAVFPAGTFNHFAKDIGCDTVAKTVDGDPGGDIVAASTCVCLNEKHMVVNTASIGAYPPFVQTREKLEHKIGKPLAGLYAMFHTLRRDRAGAHLLRQHRRCRRRCSSSATRSICRRASRRRVGRGWTTG